MSHWDHLRYRSISKQLMRSIAVTKRILGREESLSCRSVPFAFGIFLERVRYRDRSVAQILPVHCIECCVGSVEAGEVDESEAFAVAGLWISHNFRCLKNDSESAEGVVQELLVHFRIKIPNEYVRSDIEILLMS